MYVIFVNTIYHELFYKVIMQSATNVPVYSSHNVVCKNCYSCLFVLLLLLYIFKVQKKLQYL